MIVNVEVEDINPNWVRDFFTNRKNYYKKTMIAFLSTTNVATWSLDFDSTLHADTPIDVFFNVQTF